MKTLKLYFVSASVLVLSATLVGQPKPWVVPAASSTMKNPVAQSAASTKTGLDLYTKNCASCHGKAGLGDGVKALSLIHISEPTRLLSISYAVFCLKKKNNN